MKIKIYYFNYIFNLASSSESDFDSQDDAVYEWSTNLSEEEIPDTEDDDDSSSTEDNHVCKRQRHGASVFGFQLLPDEPTWKPST